ncbi:MAG: TerB family tellurite resistance protein [Kiloniellales bacterium]
MLDRIKALLSERGGPAANGARHDAGELRLAAAALLVEAARLDGRFDAVERERITGLVRQRFGLTDAEAARLFTEAEKAAKDASQLYCFTRVIKDRFPHDERVELIEMLWNVAYADGVLHDYEASLLRRIAGLIYVSDRESGRARKRVLERLGMG